jgi:hypothetical protein
MLNAPVPHALFWLPPLLLGSARLLDAVVLSLLLGLLLGILAPLHRRLGPGLAPAIALMTLGTAAGGLAQLGAEALGLFPLPPALLLLGALSASLLALPGEARVPMFNLAAISWLIAWSALAALREGLGAGTLGAGLPLGPLWESDAPPLLPFLQSSAGALVSLALLASFGVRPGANSPPSQEALAEQVAARRVRVTGPVK